MSDRDDSAVRAIFDKEEVREVLGQTFYKGAPPKKRARAKRERKPKPDHYDVICISLYKDDLERLDAKVKRLKEHGHRKMSRSALIRYALDTADLDGLPRSY